jgi:hypothetical protein
LPPINKPKRLTTAKKKALGRKRSVFPAHLQTTPQEWRALKRQEWRDTMHALGIYEYGCAYTPASRQLWQLRKLVTQISEELERDDWVAW